MNARLIKRISLPAALALGAAAMLVLFFFDPVQVPIYPVCQFHQWTHLDCPGCGGLRAMHALLHGQTGEALHFNAMFVLSLPLLAVIGGWFLLNQLGRARPVFVRPAWLWAYLGVWIAFSILRNVPVQPFTAFAP